MLFRTCNRLLLLLVVVVVVVIVVLPQSVKMNYNNIFLSKTLSLSQVVYLVKMCKTGVLTHSILHNYVEICTRRTVSKVTSVEDREAVLSKKLKASRSVVKGIRTFLNGVDTWDSLRQLT